MSHHRRNPGQVTDEAIDAHSEALQTVEIDLSSFQPGTPFGAIVDARIDDRSFTIIVEHKAYRTGQTARPLIAGADRRPIEGLPMVVGDRMTAEARTLLTDADGRGWTEGATCTCAGRPSGSIWKSPRLFHRLGRLGRSRRRADGVE